MNKSQIIDRSQPIPQNEFASLAGVDEAGRGALAGPIVVSAVVLRKHQEITGCIDSKKLSAKRRERLAEDIKDQALAWAIEYSSVEEIRKFNILHATMRAMVRVVKYLSVIPDLVLVDGNKVPPGIMKPCYAVIGGDERVNAISAASILAKVARDEEMCNLHSKYPKYRFEDHKGYGTTAHFATLHKYGQCPIHRQRWKSVQNHSKQHKLNLQTTGKD